MARACDDLPRLALEEFLAFDDGTATRYELRDGWLYAENPASTSHCAISRTIAGLWSRSPDKGRCRPLEAAGVLLSDLQKPNYYIPDVSFTCERFGSDLYIKEARAIAEVLSHSTQ